MSWIDWSRHLTSGHISMKALKKEIVYWVFLLLFFAFYFLNLTTISCRNFPSRRFTMEGGEPKNISNQYSIWWKPHWILHIHICKVYIKSYTGNLDIYQRTAIYLLLHCLEIIAVVYSLAGASQVAVMVKNPLPMKETQEMQVWPLGQENPLEEEVATHSSILAWRIPWTEEPGGPQSIGLQSQTWPKWPNTPTLTTHIKLRSSFSTW